MKKVICIVAALVFFSFVTVSALYFTDVSEDAYYAEAAERMADAGILSGFGDGRFYGDWELTRAQFAALACKLLGKVDEATALAGKTAFDDVPATQWSTGYVNYASANGIINGDGDGKCRPDDSVRYDDAIKVIVCVLKPNADIAIDPTDWSKNFIAEAEKLGLTDNLIGSKGEYMQRSDIAVIADAAYSILNADVEETVEVVTTAATTSKPSYPSSSSSTTKATTETTTVVTTTVITDELHPEITLGENDLPILWD